MRKNVVTTVCTFAIAAVIIAGGTGLTTLALAANNTEASITAEKLTQPKGDNKEITDKQSKVTISSMEDSAEMAAMRTGEEMDKEKATDLALEALETKFAISLDGTYATPILCTRTGSSELVYFVSFVEPEAVTMSDDEMIKRKEAVLQQKEEAVKQSDVYIAFINAKTGEVISAEKNPVGVEEAGGKG